MKLGSMSRGRRFPAKDLSQLPTLAHVSMEVVFEEMVKDMCMFHEIAAFRVPTRKAFQKNRILHSEASSCQRSKSKEPSWTCLVECRRNA